MARFTAVITGGDRLFREGLEQLLRPTSFAVVGSAKYLLQIEPGLERLDLIILGFDRETNVEEQFKSLSCIRIGSPPPRVVALTCLPNGELLSRASAANIGAVLSKDISTEVLQRSLELVMLGQQVFPALAMGAATFADAQAMPASQADEISVHEADRPDTSQPINAAPPAWSRAELPSSECPDGGHVKPLSDREDQILLRLVAGAANKSIARDLGITEGTVKVHVKSLLRKLGASNRTQAAIWGMGRSLLASGPVKMADPSAVSANGAELHGPLD